MPAKKSVRKRFFVDYRVQGALIVRVALYWLMCLLTITLLLLAAEMVTKPMQPLKACLSHLWAAYGPVAVVSLLVLPVVMLDLVHVSNRFAGPMVRLRRAMHDLAKGRAVDAVQFRSGDFWQDFARDFNTVAQRVEEAKTEALPKSTMQEAELV